MMIEYATAMLLENPLGPLTVVPFVWGALLSFPVAVVGRSGSVWRKSLMASAFTVAFTLGCWLYFLGLVYIGAIKP